ncbi:MAG: DUF4402 domain-containing protein [Gammaproteobacteria bacterium]|nr:DUF4402 domain-containing protein [Gammaproteobacteria bacterium]
MIRKKQLYTPFKVLPAALLVASGAVHAEDFSMDVLSTIQVAATATKVTDLGFGSIAADPAGFTADIKAGNGSTTYPAATTAGDNTGSDASAVLSSTKATISGESAGLITVSGINGIRASLTFDAATTNLVCATNTLSTMTLAKYDDKEYTAITAPATVASGATASDWELGCTIGSTGNCQIYIGGQLTVGANQEACDYSGTVNMTVAYQ